MKKTIALLMALVMVIGLAACGAQTAAPAASTPATSTSTSTETKTEAEPAKTEAEDTTVYTITIGTITNEDFDEVRALRRMDELLQERTNGRLRLEIYPSSQLGSEREMAEQVVLGTLDIGISDGPTWSNTLNIPELAVWGLPFLYNGLDEMGNVIKNILIPESAKMMEGSGVTPLFGFCNGIREAYTTTKPIYTVDDIKGLKMRVPEISLYVDTWTNLGANATTTPWSEAYTALSQGVVDGVEVDPAGLTNANLQEVVKYMSMTNHMGVVHILGMNTANWEAIPEDLRAVFMETTDEIIDWQIAERKAAVEESLDKIRAAGVEINEISVDDWNVLAQQVQPMYDQYDEMYGLGDLIKNIQAVAAGK